MIRSLTIADIPAALRLAAAAGWNQTAADWHDLLYLAPDTCFAIVSGGTLAATTAAICYGQRLAWIGMVLTDPAHRRRGFARQLMEHALETLAARGIHWIKLDATDMGAPLYRRLGFEDESAIERWRGMAPRTAAAETAAWDPGCADLDRAATGVDRSQLLIQLAPMGAAACPGEGYAMARPGAQAAYFGPCIGRSFETAGRLLAWLGLQYPQQPVYWDLLPDNFAAVRLARAAGFAPARRLTRMVRAGVPGAPPLARHDAQVFAIAGFEYG